MYDRKETTEQAAARLGLPEQFTAMHVGYHVCVDGRHYRYSCLITDPDCDNIARGRLGLPKFTPVPPAVLAACSDPFCAACLATIAAQESGDG